MPFFQEAQGITASGTFTDVGGDNITNNNYINQSPETKDILATLKPVNHGGKDVRTCTKGTRARVFEEINRWLEDLQAPNILWVSGSPGAGKSTIAATLVSTLADERRLGASFFFKHGDAALSEPASVWSTVAFHLAQFHPAVAYSLVNDIKGGRLNPERVNIESHFNCMIKEALTMEKASRRNDDALRRNEDILKKNKDELKKTEDAVKKSQDGLQEIENAQRNDARRRNGVVPLADLEALKKALDKMTKERETLTNEQGLLTNEEALIKEGETLANYREELMKLQFVVVLDALDECGWESSQSDQRRTFLDSLTNWTCLPPRFKLVVTGRDERIPRSFRDVCQLIELPTGDLATSEEESDIAHFLQTRFDAISEGYPTLLKWPSKATIEKLTARAAGLFIWAETVVRFVNNGKDAPDKQLDLVLGGDLGKEGDTIAGLYRRILDISFKDWEGRVLDVFHAVVGAIVFAKVPLRRGDLQYFLSTAVSETQIDLILNKLSSVISIGKADGVLHICHLSFAEFLRNSPLCPESFRIDHLLHGQNLASACFRLMKTGLKFNIRDLAVFWMHNRDIKDLTARMEKFFLSRTSVKTVPFPCLLYSCRFWAEHLRDIPNKDFVRSDPLLKEVKHFFHMHLIYWLAVMTLLEEESTPLSALPLAIQWIGTSDAELEAVAQSASKLVIEIWTNETRTSPPSIFSRAAGANPFVYSMVGRDQHITYIDHSASLSTLRRIINSIGSHQRNNTNHTYQPVEDKEILATLKPVYREGSYVQPCMEGTRTGILQEIDVWLEDTKAANILWLSGSPGAGKSAIMSGLASKLRKQHRLGASFFFRRGDVTLSDPAMVWRTVAFDLTEFHPAMASSLVKNIRQRGVDPATTDIEPHFVAHGSFNQIREGRVTPATTGIELPFNVVGQRSLTHIREFGGDSATADIESHFSYMIEETLTKNKAWEHNEVMLEVQNAKLKLNEDALKGHQEALKKNPDALENNHNALAGSEDELRRKGKMNGMVLKEGELGLTMDLEVLKNILQMLKEGKRLLEVERVLLETRKTLLEERKSLLEGGKALLKERKSLTKHRDELKALRPVIILDALNECGRQTSQSYQRQAFIDTLMMWLRLPSAFKLIITSRDKPAPLSLRDTCKQMELPTGLHTTPEAWDDIRRFLGTRFVNLSARFPSLSNWPGQTKIDQLTTCAAGVFIWAETVIRFVDNGGDAPDQQLDLVLEGLGKEGDTIDALYRKILRVSFGDADNHTLDAFRHFSHLYFQVF